MADYPGWMYCPLGIFGVHFGEWREVKPNPDWDDPDVSKWPEVYTVYRCSECGATRRKIINWPKYLASKVRLK